MAVWQPDELYQEAETAVAEQEQAGNRCPRARPAREPPEDDEQRDALQCELVELGRMPGDSPQGRIDHAPGQAGRGPPQLAVYEIAEPAGAQSDRRQRRDEIGKGQEGAL